MTALERIQKYVDHQRPQDLARQWSRVFWIERTIPMINQKKLRDDKNIHGSLCQDRIGQVEEKWKDWIGHHGPLYETYLERSGLEKVLNDLRELRSIFEQQQQQGRGGGGGRLIVLLQRWDALAFSKATPWRPTKMPAFLRLATVAYMWIRSLVQLFILEIRELSPRGETLRKSRFLCLGPPPDDDDDDDDGFWLGTVNMMNLEKQEGLGDSVIEHLKTHVELKKWKDVLLEFRLFAFKIEPPEETTTFDSDRELRRLHFFRALLRQSSSIESTQWATVFKRAAQEVLQRWSPHRVLELGPDDGSGDLDAYDFTNNEDRDVGVNEGTKATATATAEVDEGEEEEGEGEGERAEEGRTPKSLIGAARRALTPNTKIQIALLAAAAVPRARQILEELEAKPFASGGEAKVRSSLEWSQLDAFGKKPQALLVKTRGPYLHHVLRKAVADESAAKASLNAVEELLGP